MKIYNHGNPTLTLDHSKLVKQSGRLMGCGSQSNGSAVGVVSRGGMIYLLSLVLEAKNLSRRYQRTLTK